MTHRQKSAKAFARSTPRTDLANTKDPNSLECFAVKGQQLGLVN